MKRYVVTNHRFTDVFRRELAASLFAAAPSLFLECEEMTFNDVAPVASFHVTIDQIGNAGGVFFALGYTTDLVLRIEEEMGTLYVSVL